MVVGGRLSTVGVIDRHFALMRRIIAEIPGGFIRPSTPITFTG